MATLARSWSLSPISPTKSVTPLLVMSSQSSKMAPARVNSPTDEPVGRWRGTSGVSGVVVGPQHVGVDSAGLSPEASSSADSSRFRPPRGSGIRNRCRQGRGAARQQHQQQHQTIIMTTFRTPAGHSFRDWQRVSTLPVTGFEPAINRCFSRRNRVGGGTVVWHPLFEGSHAFVAMDFVVPAECRLRS